MSKANKLITDHLDIWTSAIKSKSRTGRGSNKAYELYGIKKLRELILDLAVRGLLVPQDPNDEPASVLLEKIKAEKKQLIKEGKIKKQKLLPPINEDEINQKVSNAWEYVRFGDIVEIERGGSPRPIKSYITDDPNGLNWIKIGDTEKGGKYITSTNEKIRKEGLKKTRMVYPGDFLLTNSMSFGRPYISKIEGCIHDGWLRISPPKSIITDYLYLFLSSPFIVNAFKKSAAGAVVLNLNAEKVREVIFLLPPNNEQKRIVAKVGELLALCDQLEQQTETSIDAHKLLVENLLAALTQAKDHQTFQLAWHRIAQKFDTLFTTEHSIDQLKQTILQLAVMGKLVPQDPNDEPASELLKRIAAEKEKLIKEGKIKKQKQLLPIIEEEKPFELPESWEWCRLNDAVDVRDGTHDSPKEAIGNNTYPLITSKHFKNGDIDFVDAKRISESDHFDISKRSLVEVDDILFSMIGGNIGNQVIVKDPRPFSVKNVALFKYYIKSVTLPKFFKIYIEELAYDLQNKASGGAQPFVSLGALRNLVFALPPIKEQKLIVAKVDELMTICDQISIQIANSKKVQTKIADSLTLQ